MRARLHHQRAKKKKRLGIKSCTGSGQCRLCGSFLDSTCACETCSTAEATRGHCACVRAVLGGLKLADTAITTEPRGVTERQSRPADLFTQSGSGRVCGSPMQQQLEEMQRKLLLIAKKHIIRVQRAQGIVHRPLVCTTDGRPHPAVTRTILYAADIASCLNGQETSAEALRRRWKHEIQIALLRRRAVLPRTPARELRLLDDLVDRATSWFRARPLDGGDDKDADTGTDTTAPDDDNDDINSFSSQQTTPFQTSNPVTVTRAPLLGLSALPMDQHALELEGLFEVHGVCSCTITNSLDLEHVVYEQRASFNHHLQPCN